MNLTPVSSKRTSSMQILSCHNSHARSKTIIYYGLVLVFLWDWETHREARSVTGSKLKSNSKEWFTRPRMPWSTAFLMGLWTSWMHWFLMMRLLKLIYQRGSVSLWNTWFETSNKITLSCRSSQSHKKITENIENPIEIRWCRLTLFPHFYFSPLLKVIFFKELENVRAHVWRDNNHNKRQCRKSLESPRHPHCKKLKSIYMSKDENTNKRKKFDVYLRSPRLEATFQELMSLVEEDHRNFHASVCPPDRFNSIKVLNERGEFILVFLHLVEGTR